MRDIPTPDESLRFDRRKFIGISAAAAATPIVAGTVARRASAAPARQLEEATIAELQAQMTTGGLTAHSLVQMYLTRIDAIDRRGGLNSILQLNPDAQAIAKQLDAERKAGKVRGPLHGIPVTLKGNIDTGDKMETTAGSLALAGAVLDRNPCGSSSGSVADAAAILTAIVSRTADPRDPATRGSPTGGPRPTLPADYTQFVNPNGLRGAKIRALHGPVLNGYSEETDGVYADALQAMRDAGATVVDIELPHLDEILASSAVPQFLPSLPKDVPARRGAARQGEGPAESETSRLRARLTDARQWTGLGIRPRDLSSSAPRRAPARRRRSCTARSRRSSAPG
jgi:Asp-tRNA(Asn)/Glu-tRNA(Gln) amidotransferase A subunit family amidase